MSKVIQGGTYGAEVQAVPDEEGEEIGKEEEREAKESYENVSDQGSDQDIRRQGAAEVQAARDEEREEIGKEEEGEAIEPYENISDEGSDQDICAQGAAEVQVTPRS